ncbi:hypothetical protein SK3146_06849 [Paenibacillus konkukensis]|uniref:Uncharacterized protein n=1 Tax=Paenibacillus konkukensis TaxID=2020716 RepID=A0ABY4RWU6_9BACL|nr:hypothetical protein SK3146_05761 [Paenibacillus konkukensis]UQZ87547.1 hypothetical protein SK3146_06849 [Paenibacillus konkukensis]
MDAAADFFTTLLGVCPTKQEKHSFVAKLNCNLFIW